MSTYRSWGLALLGDVGLGLWRSFLGLLGGSLLWLLCLFGLSSGLLNGSLLGGGSGGGGLLGSSSGGFLKNNDEYNIDIRVVEGKCEI